MSQAFKNIIDMKRNMSMDNHVTEYSSLWFGVASLTLGCIFFQVILQDLTLTPNTNFPMAMQEF